MHSVLLEGKGGNPLKNWGFTKHCTQKIYSKDIKSFVFSVAGGAGSRLFIPKASAKQNLNLHFPYVVFQLSIPPSQSFAFEIAVNGTDGTRRRLFFSTAFRDQKITPLHARIPLHAVMGKWVNLVIDVAGLLGLYFDISFAYLSEIVINPNANIHRIFVLREKPPPTIKIIDIDIEEEKAAKRAANPYLELQSDVDTQPVTPIHHSLLLSPTISCETQLLNADYALLFKKVVIQPGQPPKERRLTGILVESTTIIEQQRAQQEELLRRKRASAKPRMVPRHSTPSIHSHSPSFRDGDRDRDRDRDRRGVRERDGYDYYSHSSSRKSSSRPSSYHSKYKQLPSSSSGSYDHRYDEHAARDQYRGDPRHSSPRGYDDGRQPYRHSPVARRPMPSDHHQSPSPSQPRPSKLPTISTKPSQMEARMRDDRRDRERGRRGMEERRSPEGRSREDSDADRYRSSRYDAYHRSPQRQGHQPSYYHPDRSPAHESDFHRRDDGRDGRSRDDYDRRDGYDHRDD
ncbi:putative multi-domain containing protein, partial [Aduncisulcus paluster]